MANSDVVATLNPVAQKLASDFLVQYPYAQIISGRRTVDEQAQAMAYNVCRNPRWIALTYVVSPVALACQAWVNEQTLPINFYSASKGLCGIMESFRPEELIHLSWHLTGDAFDVEPTENALMSKTLAMLLAHRIADGGQGRFLTTEGGLPRWHVQVC